MQRMLGAMALWLSTMPADAALHSRLSGQAYYDDVLDITWVADANLAQTSGYDADGLMNWDAAQGWIASLNTANYLGANDWRLPTVTDTGAPGCNFGFSGTDCGFNVDLATGEMAHMFYGTLGNVAAVDTSGTATGCESSPPDFCLTNIGPFSNFEPTNYWYGTPNAPSEAWYMNFLPGVQSIASKGSFVRAWAVRDGDIAPTVPAGPSLQWLGGSLGIGSKVFISDNGGTVAFFYGANAVRWTGAGGSIPYSFAPQTTVGGLSTDGAVMVGNAGVVPYRWDTTGGYQALPFIDPVWTNGQFPATLSADGSIIASHANVGGGCCAAVVHRDGLPSYLPGGNYHLPTHMTPDGRVIVGYNQLGGTYGANVWTYSDAMQVYELDYLDDEPGAGTATVDTPTAVSADGTVIVGGHSFNGSTNAWYFVAPAGFKALAQGSYTTTSAQDLDATGSRAVGWGLASGVYTAIVWNGLDSGVPVVLQDQLAALGVPVDGELLQATGVSADGTRIVGVGRRSGETGYQAFLANIAPLPDADGDGIPDTSDNCTLVPNPNQCDSDGDSYGNRCDGDMNNNGATNAQDTALFRQQLGQPSVGPTYNKADLNCNGAVNAQDTALFRQLLGAPPGPSGLRP
ncbi:MAG: DUF1566 domain-containing protein [Chromatiales bacterium]|nr:DUF1566 domain-containing protein [Chromatiales bacterium]